MSKVRIAGVLLAVSGLFIGAVQTGCSPAPRVSDDDAPPVALRLADAIVVWNPNTATCRVGNAWVWEASVDLKRVIKKVTGHEPQCYVEGKEPADAKAVIYLGDTKAARAAGCDPSGLRRGDWRILAKPGRVYLYSPGGFGSSWAMTDFVERYCGYWFLTPDGDDPFEFDPERTIPCVDRTVKSALYQREIYTSLHQEPWIQFARRRQARSLMQEIEPRYRVSYNVRTPKGETRTCHSSFCYLPPEEHFKDHPEWYSFFDGSRQCQPLGQICMTNPEARRKCVERLLSFVARDRKEFPNDPPAIYDFTQQDIMRHLCQCPECKKVIARYNRVPGGNGEGGDAGLQLEFINAIAREVAKTYPDVKLRVFAYLSTSEPPNPKLIRPEPNVVIWYCDLYTRCDHTVPLATPGHYNGIRARELRAWAQMTPNVYLWDYMIYGGGEGSDDCPEFNPDAISADVKFFRDLHIEQMFLETERQYLDQPFYWLHYYLLSQCYIDPETDVDAATRTYCRVYGKGAEKMYEALQFLRAIERKSPAKTFEDWTGRVQGWRTFENWRTFRALVTAAYEAAEKPSEKARIARVLSSTARELVRLCRQTPGEKAEMERAKADYLRYGREWAVCAPLRTEAERKKLVEKMEETLALATLDVTFDDLPAELANVPQSEIKCLDYHYFVCGNRNGWVKDDPDSTTGQASIWKYGKPDGEQSPFPITCGVYDHATKIHDNYRITREDAKRFADGKYHWIKLGSGYVGRNSVFWIPWDWNCGFRLKSFYIGDDGAAENPNLYDVYLSLKLTGNAYVPGSKEPNGIWTDRLVLRHRTAAAKPAEPTFTADRTPAVYRLNETASVTLDEPRQAPRTFTGTKAECGLLRFSAKLSNGKPAQIGVMFAPEAIRTARPEPPDFDAYWAGELAKMEADTPLATALAQTTLRKVSSDATRTVYDVTIPTMRGRKPVRGYLTVPATAAKGRHALVYRLNGAGTFSAPVESVAGAVVFSTNPHGIENGLPESEYVKLRATPVAKGGIQNYQLTGWENRDTCYFHDQILRLVRGLQWLKTRPEWNGRDLIAQGGSMGGSQAIQIAALDRDVTVCAPRDPALCDHAGHLDTPPRAPGWPHVRRVKGVDADLLMKTADYYNNVFFARRIRCEAYFATGFCDTTCNSEGVYLAYNNATNAVKRVMTVNPTAGHCGTVNAPALARQTEIVAGAGAASGR